MLAELVEGDTSPQNYVFFVPGAFTRIRGYEKKKDESPIYVFFLSVTEIKVHYICLFNR